MLELIQSHPDYVRWLLVFSLVMFIGSLIAVPYLISIIPEDYFLHEHREATLFSVEHPVLRAILFLVKNILGVSLVILGILMLVLPGQGILTIITGLVFMDFPRKYELERWLVSHKSILKTMNWFRERMKKLPLLVH